jgi:hypothetical protein
MRIGQGRRSADIHPLVYGDLDQEGIVQLHLDQGIYDLKGGHTQTRLQEDARQLEVRAGGELFYFPLRVRPKDELADAARRLGV